MDTVENLHKELEKCIAGINQAGLGSLDAQNIDKLDALSAAAAGLGMNQGEKLIDNLSAVLRAFKDGKSTEDSVGIRMSAMDFYLQNTDAQGATEDL